MSEVFIVSAGEDADYHILGIFTTREKADSFCAAHNAVQPDLFADGKWYGGDDNASVEDPVTLDIPNPPTSARWEATFTFVSGWHNKVSDRCCVRPIVSEMDSRDVIEWRRIGMRDKAECVVTVYRETKEKALRAIQWLKRAFVAGTLVLPPVPPDPFDATTEAAAIAIREFLAKEDAP